MSSGTVSAYGTALGVIRHPPSMRALTLPDLPRLIPSAFISRAVAMIAARSARESGGNVAMLGVQTSKLVGVAGETPFGDVAGDQALWRDVEREVHRVRGITGDRDLRRLPAVAAAANAQD